MKRVSAQGPTGCVWLRRANEHLTNSLGPKDCSLSPAEGTFLQLMCPQGLSSNSHKDQRCARHSNSFHKAELSNSSSLKTSISGMIHNAKQHDLSDHCLFPSFYVRLFTTLWVNEICFPNSAQWLCELNILGVHLQMTLYNSLRPRRLTWGGSIKQAPSPLAFFWDWPV